MITRENFLLWRNQFDKDYTLYQLKLEEYNSALKEQNSLENKISDLKIIQSFLNKIINSKQTECMKKVLSIVSFGLASILENPDIKLEIKESLKRNQKFYEFQISYGTFAVPLTAVGGGIINLLSFLLRVTLLSLSSNRRFLVLDEVFSNLSVNYRERIGDFLKMLVDKTNTQILMVSHQQELDEAADVLLELRKQKDKVVLVNISK